MKAIFAATAFAAGLALAGSAAAVPITGLFNTGTDASNAALAGGNGATDTHYFVQGPAGAFNAVTYTHPSYFANDANSRWVSLSANGEPGNNTTTYFTTFTLAGLDAATASLSGDWGVDNEAVIFLNGVDTGISLFGNTLGVVDSGDFGSFQSLAHFTINAGFVAGLNTLEFRVTDLGPPGALRVDNLTGSAVAVPEPMTWALMILGFGGVGGVLRSQRRKAVFA